MIPASTFPDASRSGNNSDSCSGRSGIHSNMRLSPFEACVWLASQCPTGASQFIGAEP